MDLSDSFGSVMAGATAIGIFGAIGLALMVSYSRRGPLIYPVYAAILAALALLRARFTELSYASRFAACLVEFSVASAGLYVTVGVSARRSREQLVRQGRIAARPPHVRVARIEHAWRIACLLAVEALVSAGITLVSV